MAWSPLKYVENLTSFLASVGNNIEEGIREAKEAASLTPPNERTANYTLTLSDSGKSIDANKSTEIKITVPPNSAVPFEIGTLIQLCQVGTGTLAIVAGAGVTIRSAAGLAAKAQWSVLELRKRALNEWVLSQDTTTVAELAIPGNVSPPTIEGAAIEGETLAATTGTWTEGPESFTYQWVRCNTSGVKVENIAGATATTYKLVAADVGKTIRVAVVATNKKGSSAAVESAQTAVVTKPSELATFSPTIIPLSAAAIINSGTGLYEWQGGTSGRPAGWPMRDCYLRDSLEWKRDLETSEGVYPFKASPGTGPIAEWIKKAEEKGGRMRLRIMPCNPPGTLYTPAYITTQTVEGFTFPRWNDTSFLTGWKNLWKALGEVYGANPRIGWIDVGGYGWAGEQAMSPVLGKTTEPEIAEKTTHITLANFEAMVDAVVKAFPKAHVLISPSAPYKTESPYQQGLIPGVIKNFPTVGFIYDNLGVTQPVHGNNLPHLAPGGTTPNEEVWKRWQTAPVISEWWNNLEATVPQAKIEVGGGATNEAFHTSGVGSGNIKQSIREGNEAEYAVLLKEAGFRYELHTVKVPSTIVREKAFAAESTWRNANAAPTYDPWAVEYQLRTGTTVVWHGVASKVTLKKLFNENGEVTYVDTLTVPSSVAAGSYTLAIVVKDENAILAPMNLAIEGQEADGSYKLGTVTVA